MPHNDSNHGLWCFASLVSRTVGTINFPKLPFGQTSYHLLLLRLSQRVACLRGLTHHLIVFLGTTLNSLFHTPIFTYPARE